MTIKCVIFDCDGLMFDSERASKRNWRRICAKHGLELTDEFYENVTGTTRQFAEKFINEVPGLPEIMPEIRANRNNAIFGEATSRDDFIKPGLVELLDWLTEHNMPFAVASSSNLDYVKTLLGTLPKEYPFTALITGDMVTHGKPDPEVFLTAANKCGIEPEYCLVLEDSRHGLQAGKRAGMTTGFIEDTIKKDDFITQHADHTFDDLSQVISFLEQ